MTSPPRRSTYGTKEYWNRRYEHDENTGAATTFDWFAEYSHFKSVVLEDVLNEARGKESAILEVGCGNSTLAESLYDDGYKNIVAIDFSDLVIQAMKERSSSLRPHLQYEAMDATELSFSDSAFDCILDKGLLDAAVNEFDEWKRYAERNDLASCPHDGMKSAGDGVKIVNEMHRVLKTGGKLVVMSLEGPSGRKPFFGRNCEQPVLQDIHNLFKPLREKWDVKSWSDDLGNYIYVCTVL